jgi:hypothetical protein
MSGVTESASFPISFVPHSSGLVAKLPALVPEASSGLLAQLRLLPDVVSLIGTGRKAPSTSSRSKFGTVNTAPPPSRCRFSHRDWSHGSQHFVGFAVNTAPPPQSHLGEQVTGITHCLIFVLDVIRLSAQY